MRHNERWASYGGTRSQTIIVAERQCRVTWYCYRETDSALPGGGGGCGKDQEGSGDGNGADHRVHVFGVPWPRDAAGAGLLVEPGKILCLGMAALAVAVSLAQRLERVAVL